MEAELKASCPGSRVTLVKGSGGVFDVTCDGRLIFSKLRMADDRFPRRGEIAALVEGETG